MLHQTKYHRNSYLCNVRVLRKRAIKVRECNLLTEIAAFCPSYRRSANHTLMIYHHLSITKLECTITFCFYNFINGLIKGKYLKNRGSRFEFFLLTNAGNLAHFEWIWAGLAELLNRQITKRPWFFLGLTIDQRWKPLWPCMFHVYFLTFFVFQSESLFS